MIKCVGCGIKLQDINPNEVGYTPNMDNKLCERCFKLKNYNVLVNQGVNINNDKLLDKINKLNVFVFFLVDFVNLDKEVIDTFKKIKSEKVLVISKVDIIPKNIKYDKLVVNIKNVYEISDDIILSSSKNNFNIKKIIDLCKMKKNVVLVGFTNAGKSSLINNMLDSDITVSRKSNTTQDFIKLKTDEFVIYDAPGFMSNFNRENIPRSVIRPKVYQLPKKHYLLIGDVKLNILEDTNFTVYVSNEINILRRREKEVIDCNIIIPKNSDLILKGMGFIKFKNTSLISLNTSNYEIRSSIIGDSNE